MYIHLSGKRKIYSMKKILFIAAISIAHMGGNAKVKRTVMADDSVDDKKWNLER